ncbi:MAG: hypothetical protein Q8L27_04140 [archaeon]|nr:hypothetical protein [archaeon]
MTNNLRKLTGTLTIEGTMLEIRAHNALVALTDNHTLTQGNTKQDGDPKNKYTSTYFIPLEKMNLPQGRSLDYIHEKLKDSNYHCRVQMIIEPNLTSKIEILEPELGFQGHWSDFPAEYHPCEELFKDVS